MKEQSITGIVIVIVCIVVVLALIGSWCMMGFGGYQYGMMGYYPGFWFMPLIGGLFMILLVVALILLIVWLGKQMQQGANKPTRRKR